MNILRIPDQYIHQSLIFMFDYINNTLPVSFNGLFRYVHEARENYATRQSNHFIIKRGVSNFYEKLPIFNIPLIWNDLSPNLDLVMNRRRFKKDIRNRMISEYSPSIKCNNIAEIVDLDLVSR